MTVRTEQFTVASEPTMDIRFASRRLTITEGESDRVDVTIDGHNPEEFTVEQRGERIYIEKRSSTRAWSRGNDITVRVPSGTEVVARLANVDVDCSVPLRALQLNTASGDVRVDTVTGDVAIKTANWDVTLDRVDGRLSAQTASGDVRVGSVARDITMKTANGDVQIGHASAPIDASTASGDLRIDSFEGSQLSLKSMSGDVRVGFIEGMQLAVDSMAMSGRVRNELDGKPPSDGPSRGTAHVQVKTMSGDITIGPA